MIPSRFPEALVRAADKTRILGIRAGGPGHRFTGVWVVVARGRVFVRSWEMTPSGWWRALAKERTGAMTVGRRTIRIRSRIVRSASVLSAVDAAYASKYATPGALKYVAGFRRGKRRASTTELLPAL